MPTIAEAGVPGFDVSSWFAFFVPAKTPPAIVRQDARGHGRGAGRAGDQGASWSQLGVVVVGSTPDELAAHLKAEIDKWGPVIKDSRHQGRRDEDTS